MSVLRWFIAWLAAVLVVTVVGSVIQTQFNLARIAALDGPVPVALRVETTLFDLVSFGPTWAVIMALGLLVALTVAGLISRYRPDWATALHVLAGFTAVLTVLAVMELMLPVTAVGAARTLSGSLLLGLSGALAGLVYIRAMRHFQRRVAG